MVQSCLVKDMGNIAQIVQYCQSIHKLEVLPVHRKIKGLELGKGWTNEGIERFNTLFDEVKADRKANPSFVRTWIAKERVWLKEQMKKPPSGVMLSQNRAKNYLAIVRMTLVCK